MIITFLGVFKFSTGNYTINIMYDNVGGLNKGALVRYAGVNVGKVAEVSVENHRVKVVADISEDVKIPVGATFAIGSDGVMGAKFVNITPEGIASANYCEDNQVVNGVGGQGLDEFLAKSGKVLDKLNSLADAFNNVFGDEAVQTSMREGFLNARDISDNLNRFTKVMAESATNNQEDLHNMVRNLSGMSQRMNSVAMHLETITREASANGQTGRNVADLANKLATAGHNVEVMTKSLQTLVTDPKTQADLKGTLNNVRETSERANNILGVVSNAKLQADIMYGTSNSKWRTDMGVNFPFPQGKTLYLGASDIGASNKLDLQMGMSVLPTVQARAGVFFGDFSVGATWQIDKNFSLFTDIYDFNHTKWHLGGEYAVSDQLSIIGRTMNLKNNGGDSTYLGLRTQF